MIGWKADSKWTFANKGRLGLSMSSRIDQKLGKFWPAIEGIEVKNAQDYFIREGKVGSLQNAIVAEQNKLGFEVTITTYRPATGSTYRLILVGREKSRLDLVGSKTFFVPYGATTQVTLSSDEGRVEPVMKSFNYEELKNSRNGTIGIGNVPSWSATAMGSPEKLQKMRQEHENAERDIASYRPPEKSKILMMLK